MSNKDLEQDLVVPEPELKEPLSRRVLLILIAVCALSFIGHLACFSHLPEQVPTHWDVNGDVNGWSDRSGTLVLDLLPLLFLGLFYVVPKIDPRRGAYMHMGEFYTGLVSLFTVFLVCITWTTELTVFGIIPENSSPVGIFVNLILGLAFIFMGNYMPKIKRNYTFGVKTPWALDNDTNWRLTHRLAGALFVLMGVVMIIIGMTSKTLGDFTVWLLVGSVLISSLVMYIYSYLVFRNGNRPLRSR